ncbi:MAG TPA: YbhB/YbcL family Raf kinase inhibitor-like protein [Acidobacteriaceae bacterium]|nr:YbhB/YbcL family Raf kinase inhibitor-like protein [Acidobacteriaceae bacterium]
MTLTLSSAAFSNGGIIPRTYVQAGQNKSPPLRWQDAPEGTKSFVLVVEDHDAPVGTVTHWVAYDIPADSDGLLEGLEADQVPQVKNDMGHTGYDGPKPPKGQGPHRYHFRLAALNTNSLGLSGSPDPNAVKKAARSHVLAETELVGTLETV